MTFLEFYLTKALDDHNVTELQAIINNWGRSYLRLAEVIAQPFASGWPFIVFCKQAHFGFDKTSFVNLSNPDPIIDSRWYVECYVPDGVQIGSAFMRNWKRASSEQQTTRYVCYSTEQA